MSSSAPSQNGYSSESISEQIYLDSGIDSKLDELTINRLLVGPI